MDPIKLEEELKERTAAPRVTLNALEDNIAKVEYYLHPESCLTICILTLNNGFNVTAESACADPANYKKDIGERIALDNAKKKIWPLMGYTLKQKLYERLQKGEGITFLDRLNAEQYDLESKIGKLDAFIGGNVQFNNLTFTEQDFLMDQFNTMRKYNQILKERIDYYMKKEG